MKTFEKFGTAIPQILLPKNVDLKTWSVIACDQYTQDLEYWENAKNKKADKTEIKPISSTSEEKPPIFATAKEISELLDKSMNEGKEEMLKGTER